MANYTVKSGDTLSRIAALNGLSLQQLLALNPQFAQNPNLIKPGQAVNLGGNDGSSTSSSTTGSGAKTQAQVDNEYSAAVASHPAFAGNTTDQINYALSSGDLSGLLNSNGQPFSAADQSQAVSNATSVLAPYYAAEQTKDTGDTTSSLAQSQQGYQNYLDTQAAQFAKDKATLDQTAANNGVLFSGGRIERQKQLEDSYNRADANKLAGVSADIGNTARTFGYKYGDSALSPLSSYFNLGKNVYNAGVARGGVSSGGLSSIYNTNQGFQGTEINAAKAAAQQRAALSLANKGNKLIATGYQNQF